MTDKNEQEISNVDLQFQRTRDVEQGTNDDLNAELDAENARPGEFREQGMDRYDVDVEDTMDASDPPSTNMGQDENDYGEK
ncbi:M-like protein [Deinococcus sp. Marseille-Q6407]|uniref:M-like protein n=1 Tax=Deinococcus sp. Marseille-Q6407 TaxID=2969223 RepID=UPI0021C024F1|nr:M-like protein [Deinococcus sp. Marseille-Q6407]